QQAVEAPRFSTQSVINSFYPRSYYPGRLHLEERIPEAVAQQLTALGHEIARVGACGIGAIVTQRDPDTGGVAAGAAPRQPTFAIGWETREGLKMAVRERVAAFTGAASGIGRATALGL